MIGTYVLLTPVLLIGVALIGFIGCEWVFPLERDQPDTPTNFHAVGGDKSVTLLWDPDPAADEYEFDRAIEPPAMPIGAFEHLDRVVRQDLFTSDGFLAYVDEDLTNGTKYHYVLRAFGSEKRASDDAGPVNAVPTSSLGPFVESFNAPSPPRAGEDRFFGMAFRVVTLGMTVQKLGRALLTGNTGAHDLALIDAATLQVLGTASMNPTSEALGEFRYGDLMPSAVTLEVNKTYFVVSHEKLGGDTFFTQDTTVTTRTDAVVTSAVEGATLAALVTTGAPGQTFGPVNFQY